ncbi:glycosyltransferase family 2 protein [Saccharata proteae CBS 121410]|uniref:Glycosyltransferase family 2 protein n=1 Tax=Saccharata proteae CBS 121410 TaxID=1314787 RepID=A0A9P4LZX9_9PEZI|nr:glycosyltransferase family 2 protein [Saccharata proteae CBS 121410]
MACLSPVEKIELENSEKKEATIVDEKPVDSRFDSVTSFFLKHPDSSYTVEKLHSHDDVDLLPLWKRRLHHFAPVFTVLSLGAYFLYFTFRIMYTLKAQAKYHHVYVIAWFFISAEISVVIPAMFHHTFSLLAVRGRKRSKLRLRGEHAPTIDVFVTCCKEDVDVVLDTARAACGVDYPADRFRVVVLDDGADPELKQAVEELSLQYSNVYYHARVKVKGVPHHAKAGNLIGGTDLVTRLPGGAGEYIAALDADMIPEPDWLRAIVAHLVLDSRLALACPPQLFYNVPENDPLVQSLDAFVHVMEVTKDSCGVAWCTGSGYLIRRSALEAIGGWPVGTLAEDTFTSSLLLGAGWKTAYIHEPLQFGTVPDTYTGHLKQRTRWTLGTLQSALKQRFCLFGSMVRKMTILQRLSGLMFSVDAFFKIFMLISLLTIPVVLVSGGTLVAYTNWNQLRWQIRLAFGSLILSRINEWIYFLPSGYRLAQRDNGAMMWMAPYHAITVVRSFLLPKWLGGKPMTFVTSGSIKDELNERDAHTRAPLHRRLKVIMWDCKAYLHLSFILFVLAAVILSTVRAFTTQHNAHDVLVYLLTHAFFPPMIWIVSLTAFSIPIKYAIWPPTMPDREELLDRNPKTGIAYPKPERKVQRWKKTTFWHETQYSFVTIFSTFCFIGTFFV